jgi:hypothetical protein
MHTPAVALAWELWRRHRKRLMIMAGLFLGFALVYPKLCALAGFNPDSPDALGEILKKSTIRSNAALSSFQTVVHILYFLFLVCGPIATMFLTLLCLAWMFTFTAPDEKTKDPMAFPTRLFSLPVSTPFLFWWLVLAGQAAVVAVFWSWVSFVRQPHLEIFAAYHYCFGWMTLLALGQGIIWALASWPVTRMFFLSAVFVGFTFSPARSDIFESPYVLPPLFVMGIALARAGLQKMRHGQWQGWDWERALSRVTVLGEWRRLERFSSPAQAQLWFEWRRFVRALCLMVAAVTVLPFLIQLAVRFVFGLGPVQDDTMFGLCLELPCAALLLHGCFSISPTRNDLPFVMIRPQTNGQIMMASLRASAISTVLSWGLVLGVLCAMPLLGHFPDFEKTLGMELHCRTLIVMGLILLTWRVIPINLCFVWSGKRNFSQVPVLLGMVIYAGIFALAILSKNAEYWDAFWRLVPGLLSCWVVLKFLLAFLTFRISLKRGLLASSSMLAYLAVWALLVAALVIPTVILFHDKPWLFATCLVIILVTPLARIGFAPITLAWNRHA